MTDKKTLFPADLIAAANEERAKHGLPPLTPETWAEAQADAEAEQANLSAKADRLRELTQGGEWVPEPEQAPPAPTAPQAPTLDELTGAIKEAAEHGDWRAVHAYALELATLAVTNI